ncbi:homoserine dehydrogenase [Deferrisoma camini]|uniref:homoserine dehydrogenase n=1 Tax=Deferrisoma camini TaxID=1035120 RepID=UPI00046D1785|nr:homoserine dehydrogenase [Deferrisoma camini]
MNEIGVGVIGMGTVGAGVVQILLENADEIARRLGFGLRLVKVADKDLDTDRGIQVDRSLMTTDAAEVIGHPEVQVIVELIGGYEPAKTFLLEAIRAGKSVVTANKALLAVHGDEIFGEARARGVDVGFEASVGGGIPILRAVREGLASDRIERVYGILNGTTNYILTEMKEKGESFDRVLREAQRLGYAEADPTFDVDGVDAAHKITILTSMAFGCRVPFDQAYTEGIRDLTPQDIEYAAEFGYDVKLLGIAKRDGGRVEVRVHPTMIPSDHLLASVRGVYNAVFVEAEFLGPTLYYGQGAGRRATASAVVADVVEIARNLAKGGACRVPARAFPEDSMEPAALKPIEDVVCQYYLRFTALDRPGVLSKIAGVLGAYGISIESVVQKGRDAGQAVPLVIMTHEAREADVRHALGEIDSLGVTLGRPSLIRIESAL